MVLAIVLLTTTSHAVTCNDGETWSGNSYYSEGYEHFQTCNHHGGVKSWSNGGGWINALWILTLTIFIGFIPTMTDAMDKFYRRFFHTIPELQKRTPEKPKQVKRVRTEEEQQQIDAAKQETKEHAMALAFIAGIFLVVMLYITK